MKTKNSTETGMVCPYRLLIRARLFSKNRAEEFMDCYKERCPYYEFNERWDCKPFCRKAEHDC